MSLTAERGAEAEGETPASGTSRGTQPAVAPPARALRPGHQGNRLGEEQAEPLLKAYS